MGEVDSFRLLLSFQNDGMFVWHHVTIPSDVKNWISTVENLRGVSDTYKDGQPNKTTANLRPLRADPDPGKSPLCSRSCYRYHFPKENDCRQFPGVQHVLTS